MKENKKEIITKTRTLDERAVHIKKKKSSYNEFLKRRSFKRSSY